MDLIYSILLLTSTLSPLVLALVLFFVWKTRGRDPQGKSTVIPQYETYQQISPAVMAVVLNERISMRDILASLIDLAQRGYLHLEEQRAPQGQTFHEGGVTTNFIYLLKQEKPLNSHLTPFENFLLKSIFTAGPTVHWLNFAEQQLAPLKPQLDALIYAEAVQLGLVRNSPDTVRTYYHRLSKWVMIPGWVLLITGIGLGLILDGYLIRWFGQHMPVRTAKGVEALAWSRGLQMYIQFAERYRLNRPSGELQKLLPEAMVLNVVKEWSQHIKTDKITAPSWLVVPTAQQDWIVRLADWLS